MAVFGFSHVEVGELTMRQMSDYYQQVPNVLPLINAFAQRPEVGVSGDAAIVALRSIGISED